MHNEWHTSQLSEIVDVVMGQSPSGSTCSNDSRQGMPLLNGPTEFGANHPIPVQFTTDPKKMSETGDLLFCVRGSTTGRMNWGDQNYAIGRGIAAIRHKKGKEYQPFLKGLIENSLPELIVSATGSTFPNVSRNQLLELEIDLPPLQEQRAIAHILGSLDDKIELNRWMNETLEAVASAIFKSWFVDFDPVRAKAEGRDTGLPGEIAELFPDSFENSEIGKIPRGWNPSTVGSEFNLTMGQSPPGSTYNEAGNGLPFFQGRRDFGFRYPSKRVYCMAPQRFADPGDTLVSVRAPVGKKNMAMERCCIGRGVAGIRHKSGSRSYTYYAMHTLSDRFSRFEAEGTVFGAINKKQFEMLRWLSPGESLVDEFEKIVFPFDEQIEKNTDRSATVKSLRNTLLPKLISGELRVPDAEKFLEEAGV